MTFGKLFWRVFAIILLIIVGWWLLGWLLKLAAWLVYAVIAALVITAVVYVYGKLKK